MTKQNAVFPISSEIQWSVIEKSRHMQMVLRQLEGTKSLIIYAIHWLKILKGPSHVKKRTGHLKKKRAQKYLVFTKTPFTSTPWSKTQLTRSKTQLSIHLENRDITEQHKPATQKTKTTTTTNLDGLWSRGDIRKTVELATAATEDDSFRQLNGLGDFDSA